MDTRNISDENLDSPKEFKEKLTIMISRQIELAKKYMDIESMPGFGWDIDNPKHQVWIKDFLWRVTEELGEAWEYAIHPSIPGAPDLYYEEIADAAHFILEPLVMIYGYDDPSETVNSLYAVVHNVFDMTVEEAMEVHRGYVPLYIRHGALQEHIKFEIFNAIFHLTMAGNTLKNKKWKNTQMMTDKTKFFKNYMKAMFGIFSIPRMDVRPATSYDPFDVLFSYYVKKAKVNKFRQESNY